MTATQARGGPEIRAAQDDQTPGNTPSMSPLGPQNSSHKAKALLIAFDFDHTLIDLNSDLLPFQSPDIFPCGVSLAPRFPTLIKELGPGSWTRLMQLQLAALAQQEGYSRAGLRQCFRGVGMDEVLVRALRRLAGLRHGGEAEGAERRGEEGDGEGDQSRQEEQTRVEMVIASDANEVFIQEILAANDMAEAVFRKVYTNQARWLPPSSAESQDLYEANRSLSAEAGGSEMNQTPSSEDVLFVVPYQPKDTPHGCSRCAANMCKSNILAQAKKDLALNQDSTRTIYVGDGFNDFCPALSLTCDDILLVREGYALEKLLKRAAEQIEGVPSECNSEHGSSEERSRQTVVAEVRYWKSQEELGRLLLGLFDELDDEVGVSPSREDDQTRAAAGELAHDLARKAVL